MSRAFPPPSLAPSFSLPSSLLPLSLSLHHRMCLTMHVLLLFSIDSYWLMRSVVMRVHPTFFPGVSEEIWRCADSLTHSRTDDARIRAKDPHP